MIKFPTEYGVGEVRGDQVAAREYYIVMLEMNDHQQTMCIEEQRTAEPVEELEEVTLDDSRPKQTTRVGMLEDQFLRQPNGTQVPLEILQSSRFNPYFKVNISCI